MKLGFLRVLLVCVVLPGIVGAGIVGSAECGVRSAEGNSVDSPFLIPHSALRTPHSGLALPLQFGRSKRVRPVRTTTPTIEHLTELARRAQETADEARDEARRTRAGYEALQQQIDELRAALSRAGQPVYIAAGNETSTAPQGQPPDERLARLEEQVDINTSQIKEQAQTKVESESKFSVRLSGMILANFHYNSNDVQRSAPLFAPQPVVPASKGTFGSTFRQTRLGLTIGGPRVGGARLSGEIDFDFYGGTIGQVEGDVLGALRVRTASARLDWEHTSVVIGQEGPIISPRNPTSLATVWYPALSGAGNLWQWRPRATVEHRFKVDNYGEFIAQGSFVPPFGESYSGQPLRGTPAYETRVAWRRNLDAERTVEIGVGGHYGRRDFLYDRKVADYIVTTDWLIPFGERAELSGEFYHGRAVSLGEQSGGRIDRVYAFTGSVDNPRTLVRGVRSTGGWTQMSFRLRSDLELNFAYGQEDPSNSDIRLGNAIDSARFKNQVGSVNFIYQLRPTFLVSMEYRRLWTNYTAGRGTNNHYNLAVAYVF